MRSDTNQLCPQLNASIGSKVAPTTPVRDEFFATLVHDIKTPLVAANRAIQLLLDGDFGVLTHDQVTVLNTMLQSNNQVYAMVKTFLDVHKYESGIRMLDKQNVDLIACAANVISELQTIASDRQIHLKLVSEDIGYVYCDPAEVRRVIQNLIDNAIKYSPVGGTVLVEVRAGANEVELSVTDNGPGISEEDIDKLFVRFWQARDPRAHTGNGLGLYLCHHVMQAHGGKIWCISSPGVRTDFVISIPRAGVLGSNGDGDGFERS